MKYFDTLPKIVRTDNQGNSIIVTNLLARASVIQSLLSNPSVYYLYAVQDGDTPEIVAHKYYGDTYRYWIVLFMNQMLDPQWDWPMSSNVFDQYIVDKYPGTSQTDLHHYEQVITTTDNYSQTSTTQIIDLGTDAEAFANIVTGVNTYTLPSGSTVTVEVIANIVSNYMHEVNTNEAKRNIKILNSKYVNQIESQLNTLLNS